PRARPCRRRPRRGVRPGALGARPRGDARGDGAGEGGPGARDHPAPALRRPRRRPARRRRIPRTQLPARARPLPPPGPPDVPRPSLRCGHPPAGPHRPLDHIVPWSEGGATSLDNGNGLCAEHNQKEAAGLTARVVRDEDGTRRTVEWTTRYGQTARRRGINVDPLGTGWRLLERAAGERPPGERPPGVP